MHAAFHRTRPVIVDISTFVDRDRRPEKEKGGRTPLSERYDAGDPVAASA
jgi:hypothetical protein